MNKIKSCHIHRVLILFLIIFLTVLGSGYWLIIEKVEQVIAERVMDQELVLTRSGALSMEEYFEARKNELLLLGQMEAVKRGDERTTETVFKDLYQRAKEKLVIDVIRIDDKGVVTVAAYDPEGAAGDFLGDRDYFLWSKEQRNSGEIFISKPVVARGGPTEGEMVVLMATPVFYQGRFNGAVAFAFSLEVLTEKFVSPLALSPRAQIILVDQDGIIIVATFPNAVGSDVFDYLTREGWEGREEKLGKMLEKAIVGEEGAGINPYYNPVLEKRTKAISAHSPVKINGITWSLWASAPYEEAMKLGLPLTVVSTQGFVIISISLVGLVLIFVFGNRVIQRDAFIDGFQDGRDGVKKLKRKKS